MFAPPFLTGQNLGNLGFNTTEKKENRVKETCFLISDARSEMILKILLLNP
jgi:hypothetical protein